MRRLRLVASTVPLLLFTLACVNVCSDSTPPRATCDSADEGTIDGLELRAFHDVGGQGTDMLLIEATYLGAAPPECAELVWRVEDPDTSETYASGTEALQTNEVADGRATREAHWMIWSFPPRVLVTVEAYGHTASATVCQGDCPDAGSPAPDAGGADGG